MVRWDFPAALRSRYLAAQCGLQLALAARAGLVGRVALVAWAVLAARAGLVGRVALVASAVLVGRVVPVASAGVRNARAVRSVI